MIQIPLTRRQVIFLFATLFINFSLWYVLNIVNVGTIRPPKTPPSNTHATKPSSAVIETEQPTVKVITTSIPIPTVDSEIPRLSIAVLTIERPGNLDYVKRTVASLEKAIINHPGLVDNIIVFHPRNPKTHRHAVFEESRDLTKRKEFQFIEKDALDIADYEGIKTHRGYWRPVTEKDVQQNNDFIAMLEQVKQKACPTPESLFLIMEDDFEQCPFSFDHIRRVITASRLYYPNFTGIRISVGLNGIIFKCKHATAMQEYLKKHRFGGPADTLFFGFWTLNEDGRAHFTEPESYFLVYQHNLMDHIGAISSIVSGALMTNRVYPGCYDILQTGAIAEKFNSGCLDKELTPCSHPQMGNSILNQAKGHPQYDKMFTMDFKFDQMNITLAEDGEDCNQACEKTKSKCAKYLLPLLNSCDVLTKYKGSPCAWCGEHDFFKDPAGKRNPALVNDGGCWISAVLRDMTCEGTHKGSRRLCPCAR